MKKYTRIVLAAVLMVAALSATGCVRRVPLERDPSGESTTWDRAIPLEGGAEQLATRIAMGAGILKVAGADLNGDALEGEFTFAPKSLEPELDSDLEGDTQRIVVRHPEILKLPFGENIENLWDVTLASGIPTKLTVDMGAGESTLDLSEVEVTDLSVTLGAGKSTIDVTGDRTHDVIGRIQAGAGELIIRVPEDVPVRISGATAGVGDLKADGFTQDGDDLVNDAWKAGSVATDYKYRIDLEVQRGIGSVRLEME